MTRYLVGCGISLGLIFGTPALAAKSRDQAISECRSEGFGVKGSSSSADAGRQAMKECVQRKMKGK